ALRQIQKLGVRVDSPNGIESPNFFFRKDGKKRANSGRNWLFFRGGKLKRILIEIYIFYGK
ncbi:MAG: hypothetical protein AAF206_30300, partial [Bacteroidota bacterium]